MNQTMIIGRASKDAEASTTSNGKKMARFNVAVDRQPKTDQPDWYSVTLFGKTAEVAEQYVTKGKEVLVIGRLKPDLKDGKLYLNLDGDTLKLLGGKSESKPAGDDFGF